MRYIRTVLGDISTEQLGITLSHEHVCCFSEYLHKMAGSHYLDKEQLIHFAATHLCSLKGKYGLSALLDCTPINIGRDVELLKRVSELSGVHIVCSTGFYYTEEPVLYNMSAEALCDCMVTDAHNTNAGIIKMAVESDKLSPFLEKLLISAAYAQRQTGLPIVLHTNATNQNGSVVLNILEREGVAPQSVVIGHLSDTKDFAYILRMAERGCYIGLDRLYEIFSDEYIDEKVACVEKLFAAGMGGQVLLSHDESYFNGFEGVPHLRTSPRFTYCFEHILPRLSEKIVQAVMVDNPVRMLTLGQ